MNRALAVVFFFIMISCGSISRMADRIEESHYALYQQKALIVHAVQNRKVWFTNPAYTRYYYLKGKQYTEKWSPGDTMIIEDNLEDFYRLKYRNEIPAEN
ncbi:MAG: hypothetical protein JXA61_01960 [Bacteroidales bacterium]|nr:hypothetical protein [Bacteroidales bacterium]